LRSDVACAHLNAIGVAVPGNKVHGLFTDYAPRLLRTARDRRLFARMAERCGIERRYSVLAPARRSNQLDDAGLYRHGAFADTATRMQVYEERSVDLALAAVLDLEEDLAGITHLVVVSCAGFAAPGLDLALIERFALNAAVERTTVGFWGCYAAMNALRLGRHIVRSEPEARVLIVCLELCTLHLQETSELEQVLSFLIFADGAAGGPCQRRTPRHCLARVGHVLVPDAADQITWRIDRSGFDMKLSGTFSHHRACPAAPHACSSSGAPLETIH
jgi:alpha-pyrone synthase